jgi:hypothetical protein
LEGKQGQRRFLCIDCSLGNSLCCYAKKSGGGSGNYIYYAKEEKWWNNPIALDTIIGDTISFNEFNNRNNVPISQDKIGAINAFVQKLIDEFYQNNDLCPQP